MLPSTAGMVAAVIQVVVIVVADMGTVVQRLMLCFTVQSCFVGVGLRCKYTESDETIATASKTCCDG